MSDKPVKVWRVLPHAIQVSDAVGGVVASSWQLVDADVIFGAINFAAASFRCVTCI